jgi:type VI secretion system secreted protein VgrG
MARLMEIATPLGADTLLFHGMHAREELSRVSEFQLDLLSAKGDINLDDILGKNVTITVMTAKDQPRYFNGYVTRFAQSGKVGRYHRYLAVVRPWLWFLSRTADCRIFQNKTVPEILKTVFSDHGTAEFAIETSQTYEPWTYCVQYRETDLNFVSRLMENEGIYYYFRHTDGHNTMVLVDSSSAHSPCPSAETVSYLAPERVVRPDIEHISRWDFAREVQPGVFVHDDYDLERPSVELKTQRTNSKGYSPSDYEVYDYPGCYVKKAEGSRYADVRLDEFGTQFEIAHGSTNHRAIAVGYLFTLEGFPRSDQNREHLIVSTNYDFEFSAYEGLPKSTGAECRCTLSAMSSGQQYRPRRATPKPFVQGPQTAVVVGPAGDEIHTDKYGRVKVQFHWDRYGNKDQQSSCWIRVSHPWAGKGWGAVSIPRIGQEVIVDFLEGDPDQPIITGRVYNAECMPPYGLPAGGVVSGIKSNTHKGAGYNEMSMDDTAGKEKITIHAQYDMNTTVENNQTTTVHNNRTDTIDVDDSETVGNNQTCSVGVDQTITVGSNQSVSVGANQTVAVGANQDITVGASRSVTVGANETVVIGASQAVTVGAGQTIGVGAGRSTQVGAGEDLVIGAGRNTSVSASDLLSVGADLTLGAGGTITITNGGASITFSGSTITISAATINVAGSGAVNVEASGNLTLKGAQIQENC